MDATVVQPEDFSRRSFVQHKLTALEARFGEVDGAAVVMAYGPEAGEAEQAGHLGLADLSPLPRLGFKGPGVIEWLAAQGVEVPTESNQAVGQSDGSVAARLSARELLLVSDPAGDNAVFGPLRGAWERGKKVPESSLAYMPPRQDSHAWFALTGSQGAAALAKLCAVDLRPRTFANGGVAQTSVARLSAIIVRHDLGTTLNYYVLPDSAAAEYLWDCLCDAMTEFSGKPVGLVALRHLDSR